MKNKTSKQLNVTGSSGHIYISEFDLNNVACKIDTGAYTATLHCSRVRLTEKGIAKPANGRKDKIGA